jgi:hypothetical protein
MSLCLLVPGALAASPATVTVRVEGLNETLLPATRVTTTTTPVVKDGNSADSCPGTSALGALELATSGNWSGPWESGFSQYEIFAIEGESHVFEAGAAANYFWSFWSAHTESFVGACEASPETGQEILFFPSCYGEACPPNQALPLGLEAPAVANVGERVPLTVDEYSSAGTPSPVAGATIAGAAEPVKTAAGGHATVAFSAPGSYTLRASAPELVRTEATICVHNGNDGNCGTTKPSTPGSTTSTAAGGVLPFVAYKGPFALVAHASGPIDGHVYSRRSAPRTLAGTIVAHTAVTAVSAKLRRRYRGRCSSYDGTRERFLSARCGSGSFFKLSSGGTFSYLLPSALAPGRYVFDIKATDEAGNVTTLARGSSRLVFYVR